MVEEEEQEEEKREEEVGWEQGEGQRRGGQEETVEGTRGTEGEG